jgi:photosystem II stability/assembly factor-like uncharacterized protein
MVKVLIFILFTSGISLSQSSWDWFYATPTTNSYYSVKFINFNTGFIGGANGTLLKTTNAGINWKFIETGENGDFCSIFNVNSEIIYALCYYMNNTKFYVSTNCGANWVIKSSFPSTTGRNFKVIYFFNADTGYLAGNSGSIFYTTNGGSNWFDRSYSTIYTFHTINFLDNQTGYIAGYYNNTSGGKILIKTTNGGINWINININCIEYISSMYFMDINKGLVCGSKSYVNPFFTDTYERICRTTDGGLNWDTANFSHNGRFQNMSGVNNTVFVFGELSTRYSTDCGLTWTFLGTVPVSPTIRNSHFLDENKGYMVGDIGKILKFENFSINILNKSLTYLPLPSICFTSSDTGYLLSKEDNYPFYSDVYKTTNTGFNWTQINRFDVFYNKMMFSNNKFGIVNSNYMLAFTSNGGTNWTEKTFNNIPPYYPQIKDCVILPDSRAFAIGDSGLIINSFNLVDWNYYQIQGFGRLNKIIFSNLNTGYITSNNQILKTTNGGYNWVRQSLSVNGIASIFFLNENIGYILSVYNGTQILKTNNGGVNWFVIYNNLFPSFFTLYFLDTLNGFALGSNLYYTSDGGINWNSKNLHSTGFLSISFANSLTGFISGKYGTIFRTTTGGISFVKKTNEILPTTFFLHQNYPNPFNPSTKIKFDIPNNLPLGRGVGGMIVSLKIFDILGKEIATLVNESLSPGTYEVNWNASVYPSGVYFYKLISGENSITKKMLLIK